MNLSLKKRLLENLKRVYQHIATGRPGDLLRAQPTFQKLNALLNLG